MVRVPSGLVGTIYTQSNSGLMETPYFEKLADFSASCGYVVDWPNVAQVRFWQPKRPYLEKKDMPFGKPPYHGIINCGL